jgi:hypothetical protein
MKSGLEEALLSSMPQDVTAEEIAAIKAAAAAFSAPGNESSFRQARDRAEAPAQAQEPVAKVEERSSESVVSEPISAGTQTESAASAEQTTTVEAVSAGDVPAETVPLPTTIVSESSASAAAQATASDTRNLADDEVTAALASLAPANGHGAAATDGEAARWGLASRDQVPVTMAVAGATQEFSGPRWIAESVALLEDEASLVLEREMEKAYAAFAAADAARVSFAGSPADQAYAPSPVGEGPAANPETVSSPVELSSNSDRSEPMPPEATMQAGSEQSAAPEAEPSAVASSPIVDAVSESAVPGAKESAAFAAAASAGASAAEVTMAADAPPQASPAVESSNSVAHGSESSGRQGESELAAAWANWKQIRESVVGSQLIDSQIIGSQLSGSQIIDSQVSGSQLSSQIADAVVELKESSGEAQPTPQPETSSATGDESTEISKMVDSVLADLKPKLMAEIAKKMGKEKNK